MESTTERENENNDNDNNNYTEEEDNLHETSLLEVVAARIHAKVLQAMSSSSALLGSPRTPTRPHSTRDVDSRTATTMTMTTTTPAVEEDDEASPNDTSLLHFFEKYTPGAAAKRKRDLNSSTLSSPSPSALRGSWTQWTSSMNLMGSRRGVKRVRGVQSELTPSSKKNAGGEGESSAGTS